MFRLLFITEATAVLTSMSTVQLQLTKFTNLAFDTMISILSCYYIMRLFFSVL
jgi:hypothetical protein